MQDLHTIIAMIEQLEEERLAIYADGHVDEQENPRLFEINRELERLWDLRRRLEAARAAGLSEVPVPPPEDASTLIG